jgi:Ferredoxin
MKKVIISEGCVACGACALECDVFEELANGKVAINNKILLDENIIKKIFSIVTVCPVNAIEIIEDKVVKSQGKEGLKELSNLLKRELIDSQIAEPQTDDYKFNKEEYRIPASVGYGEYRYDYKSDDKAIQAGLKEFDRVMYSQRKALIQQVLVEYKYKKLKRYSEYETKQGNYYHDLKEKIEEVLRKVEKEAKSISNNKISLSNNFSIFEVKPDFGYDDMKVYQLRHFEELWFTNNIMNELELLYWYDTYVDTDDMEDSRGRYVYCYKNIYKICELFAKHILDEVVYVLNGSDGTQKIVSEALNNYINLVNKEINKKIEIFNNAINNMKTITESENADKRVTVNMEENAKWEYDSKGFNKQGIHKNGTKRDQYGYDFKGYDEEGYDEEGFNLNGYNRRGFNRNGRQKGGSKYDVLGYDMRGFDRNGYNKNSSIYDLKGYDIKGFNKHGIHKNGTEYDDCGYDKDGYNKNGFDKNGYNEDGYNKNGFDKNGYNEDGYNKNGFDKNGYDKDGYNKNGIHKNGTRYNNEGYNLKGIDRNGFDKQGIHLNGTKYDNYGYDKREFNKEGLNYNGTLYDDNGYDKDGYDREGFNLNGFHKNGTKYDDNGYDKDGNRKTDIVIQKSNGKVI